MESVIKWHTGEPKETGTYIVTTIEGTVAFSYYQQGFSTDEEYFKSCIIAWCKLSDIEPYEEEKK
jgi:hypothetical protein